KKLPNAAIGTNIDPTVEDLKRAYQYAIASVRTQGFFKDLLNDINGPTIHRWQILAWTLVIGGIFVIGVYSGLEIPGLGNTLLILMGISGGLYLGFKIPERL